MSTRQLLLLVLALHLVPFSAAQPQAVIQPELTYRCVLLEDGYATVSVGFRDASNTGLSAFWTLVPRNQSDYRITVTSGEVLRQDIGPASTPGGGSYVFYSNLTTEYRGPLEFSIDWNVSYATLIAEPDALYYSPAIACSPGVRILFNLTLPETTKSISEYDPIPVLQSNRTLIFALESHYRVGVAFKVSGPLRTVLLNSSRFRFRVPSRYEEMGRRLLGFYENVTEILDEIFNATLTSVNVEFFVPGTLSELSTGGFVPIASAYRLGTIYLNIFYSRTEKGYMEAIAAHELVHHYLATSGISPDVLWFHEGMANYVGIKVSEFSGLGGADLDDDLLQEALALPAGQRAFALAWSISQPVTGYSPYQHYASAFHIVATIAQNMSSPNDEILTGQAFFIDLFTNIRRTSQKITENDQLAWIMYATANFSRKAFVMLTSLGLRVRPMLIGGQNLSDYPTSIGLIATYFLYPLLEGPLNSAMEAALSQDATAALILASEANDLLAHFDTSLLVFLLLLGAALVSGRQRGEEISPPPPPSA